MLLQVFDDGHLTDAKGRKVDFRNTILIMTSNVGSDLIRRDKNVGFTAGRNEARDSEEAYVRMKDKVLNEMKNVFRPEFLNRIDSTVVFHALGRDHIGQIVDLNLRDVSKQLAGKGASLVVTEDARKWLGDKGFDPVFGARPLRRVIQNEVEDRLSEALLQGEFGAGDTVELTVDEDQMSYKVHATSPTTSESEAEAATPA
jgi:ATP-dependent Clp protease ATP-binding subunit ClpC